MSPNDVALLCVEHIVALRRFARTLVRGPDYEDLVQDTILRAVVRAETYSEQTKPRAWLFTIMRNIAITNQRRNAMHTKHEYAVRLLYGRASAKPPQSDAVMLRESVALIKTLPDPKDVECIKGVMNDQTYVEIAQACAIPEGTIKSKISRTRLRLRTAAGLEP